MSIPGKKGPQETNQKKIVQRTNLTFIFSRRVAIERIQKRYTKITKRDDKIAI